MTIPVLIDCDPGHDDAIALLLALASPELALLGVTTVSGNQTLEKTTANAIRVLDFAGRADVPVAAGADRPLLRERFLGDYVHGETGLDGPDLPPPGREPLAEHAATSSRASSAVGRPVTLIPVGPLTNVALLLALHPDAAERIERVVVMGGAIGEGTSRRRRSSTSGATPRRRRASSPSGLDVTMIGLDVTHRALLTTRTPTGCARRAGWGDGRGAARVLRPLPPRDLRLRRLADPRRRRCRAGPRADLVETKRCNVEIETGSELCRGRTVVDLRGRAGREPNAHVAVGIDADGFVELLLERVGSLR